MSEPRWPKYTWDPNARQYRGPDGRFVKRRAVRQALDEVIDATEEEMKADALRLQAGLISLIEWQIRMERHIKIIHTASAAAAAGGWAQATPADWAQAATRIRREYAYLDKLARGIDAGTVPLDGRFIARAASYGDSGSATYERVLRRNDLRSGMVERERRLIHSGRPCTPCERYAALGWQKPGVLPDIGAECDCGSHCRCSFERTLKARARRRRQAA